MDRSTAHVNSRRPTSSRVLREALRCAAVATMSLVLSIPCLAQTESGTKTPSDGSSGWGLTRDNPQVSRFQILGSETGSSIVPVDDGVARVWMDVRQPEEADEFSLSSASGEFVPSVNRAYSDVDLTGVDLLGAWHDAVSWTPSGPGLYELDSTGPHFAFVRLERGGQLEVWIEPDPVRQVIAADEPLSLFARLRDGSGQPMDGGQVTGFVTYVPTKDEEEPEVADIALAPTSEPGVYVYELPDGLPVAIYNITLTGEHENFRRDLTTTIAAIDMRSPDGMVTPAFVADAAALHADVPSSLAGKGDSGTLAPAPQPGTAGPGAPGSIRWYSDDPSQHEPGNPPFPVIQPDPGLPVVLFVHGIFADSDAWTSAGGPNGVGMASSAYLNRFRVALLDLHPAQPSSVNAQLIQAALPQVAEHFDVRSVVIVAHSKGGADTDHALMQSGTQHSRTVLTLSSPLSGTPIAEVLAIPILPQFIYEHLHATPQTAIQLTRPFRSAWQMANANNFPVRFWTFNAWGHDFEVNPPVFSLGWIYRHITGPYILDVENGPGPDVEGYNDGLVSVLGSRRLAQGQDALPDPPFGPTLHNHSYQRSSPRMWPFVEDRLVLLTPEVDFHNGPSSPSEGQAEVSDCAVALSWRDNSLYETGFEVRRSVDGGELEVLERVEADEEQDDLEELTDDDVTSGHTYEYEVAAYVQRQRLPHAGTETFSEVHEIGTVTLPASCGSEPTEEHAVSFIVSVDQPTGDPQSFDALVRLIGFGSGGSVFETESIDEGSDGQSRTFSAMLVHGSEYNITADVETDYPSGDPVASCSVGNGSGTATSDVLATVNCTVFPPESGPVFSLGAQWETEMPSGGAPGNGLTATIRATVNPPASDPGQSSATTTSPMQGGFGELIFVGFERPAGWSYVVTTENVSGGSCQVQNGTGPFVDQNVVVSIHCTCDVGACEEEDPDPDPGPEPPGGGGGRFPPFQPYDQYPGPFGGGSGGTGMVCETVSFSESGGELVPCPPPNEDQFCSEVTTGYRRECSLPGTPGSIFAGAELSVTALDTGGSSEPYPATGDTLSLVPFDVSATHDTWILTFHLYLDGELYAYYPAPPSVTAFDLPVDEIDISNLEAGIHELGIVAIGRRPEVPSGFLGTGAGFLFEVDQSGGGGSDTAPPNVELTSPPDGVEWPEGPITVRATATDASGIDRVEFYRDGTLRATDTTYPYRWTWQQATPGPHSFHARAVDASPNANSAFSDTHTVLIVAELPPDPPGCGDENPPNLDVTAPPNGAHYNAGSSITISATASDAGTGVGRVEFDVAGGGFFSDDTPPYSFTWQAPDPVPGDPTIEGERLITVTAYDGCDNTTTATRTITIDCQICSGPEPPDPPDPPAPPDPPDPPDPPGCGDENPPALNVTAPQDGAYYNAGSTVTVSATASDSGTGVDRVEFDIAGGGFFSDETLPYSYSWQSPSPVPGDPTIEGERLITVTAYDGCENWTREERTIIIQCQICNGPHNENPEPP